MEFIIIYALRNSGFESKRLVCLLALKQTVLRPSGKSFFLLADFACSFHTPNLTKTQEYILHVMDESQSWWWCTHGGTSHLNIFSQEKSPRTNWRRSIQREVSLIVTALALRRLSTSD